MWNRLRRIGPSAKSGGAGGELFDIGDERNSRDRDAGWFGVASKFHTTDGAHSFLRHDVLRDESRAAILVRNGIVPHRLGILARAICPVGRIMPQEREL